MRNFIRVSDDVLRKVKDLAQKMEMSSEDVISNLVLNANAALEPASKTSSVFKTHDGWLFIRARYTTACPICTYKVLKDKPAYWKPGYRAVHPQCRNNVAIGNFVFHDEEADNWTDFS